MPITITGNGSISGLTSTGISAVQNVGRANLPAGTILQVVSTNKTDTFTSSAQNTWTDITGMSASITPTSSSSRIMVVVSMFGVFWQQGANGCILRLLRGATNIGGGDASGSRQSCIGTQVTGTAALNTDSGVQYHFSFVDSPATTSSTTYKIQFYQDTPSSPIYVNRTRSDDNNALFPRTSSSIILLEIAS
jgi:hypothetical protein